MPDDEPFEYVITQAVADYLASELSLDGILYPSAQTEGGTNVVLFHSAARVESYALPEGTQLSAYTGDESLGAEDDGERHFSVHEEVPDNPEHEPELHPFLGWSYVKTDNRMPTLKLDVASLCVHHISTVYYTAEEFVVDRHRYPKRK